MRDQYEAFAGDYTQAFLNAEVRDGEKLFAQLRDGWKPKHLLDGGTGCVEGAESTARPAHIAETLAGAPHEKIERTRLSETHVCSLMWSEILA